MTCEIFICYEINLKDSNIYKFYENYAQLLCSFRCSCMEREPFCPLQGK